MSSHAGKTTFYIKNTSRIIPKMLPKVVQNTSKMEPKRVPKRSRRPSPKKVQKDSLKCSKGLPKMTPKRSPKSQKTVWVAFFFHLKKTVIMWKVLFSFLAPPGRPRPSKPSQNTVRVCKNRRPPFSLETLLFYKMYQKWPPLGPPKTFKNRQNDKKKPAETELKNKRKKT